MKKIIIALIVGVAVGIVATVIVTSMMQGDSSKEDFDFDYVRSLSKMDSCLKLKDEYNLIKKYESVLGHYELYLEAIEDRATEIVPHGQKCMYK